MSAYDLRMAELLSHCGWTYVPAPQPIPSPDVLPSATWVKGDFSLKVAALVAAAIEHPWCREYLRTAISRGAIGFEIVVSIPTITGLGWNGKVSALFEAEWPDAVTRLGEVVP